MPVYNVEDFISETLDSIVNQTYTNFELIIVDDSSIDRTYEICKEYADRDARIRLFHNDTNQGVVKASNFGLEQCRGYYIVKMDGDDISALDRIQRLKEFLDTHSDIDVVGSSALTIDSEGKLLGKTIFLSDQLLIKKTMLLQTPLVHIWMTYKNVYTEMKGYREMIASEDYDFILRCITSGYNVTNISEYFGYSIRINRKGNTSSTYGVKKLKTKKYVIKMYRERIRKGVDSYSEDAINSYIKTSRFEERIYKISNDFLYRAILNKSCRKYVAMIGNICCSLISPWQLSYLFNRFLFSLITK